MNISSSMSAKAPIISKPPVAQTAPQDPPVIIPEDQYTSPSKVGPALIIGGAALAGRRDFVGDLFFRDLYHSDMEGRSLGFRSYSDFLGIRYFITRPSVR